MDAEDAGTVILIEIALRQARADAITLGDPLVVYFVDMALLALGVERRLEASERNRAWARRPRDARLVKPDWPKI